MTMKASHQVNKNNNLTELPMMRNRLYSFGFSVILFYHIYQVVVIQQGDRRCTSSSSSSSEEDDSLSSRSLSIPLPSNTLPANEFLVDNTYTCVRWNSTYVLPRQPAFIIVGTQKGGTSALSALLDHHPWMESSWYFEPHFFDFNEIMLYYRLRLNDTEAMCKVLRIYLQKNYDLKRLRKFPNLMAFEKTPAYILTPNAPARIKATVPWAKIVVTLRNPVDRAISQHRMSVMRGWENRSFERHLTEDINVLRHEGFWVPEHDPLNTTFLGIPAARPIRKYRTEGMLYRGCYARQILPWLEYYTLGKDLLVIRYEELKEKPIKVLNELLDFVGAPRYDFPQDVVNRSYSPKGKAWVDYDPDVSDEIKAYLKLFYKPYNEELADVLGERWRGVWD